MPLRVDDSQFVGVLNHRENLARRGPQALSDSRDKGAGQVGQLGLEGEHLEPIRPPQPAGLHN